MSAGQLMLLEILSFYFVFSNVPFHKCEYIFVSTHLFYFTFVEVPVDECHYCCSPVLLVSNIVSLASLMLIKSNEESVGNWRDLIWFAFFSYRLNIPYSQYFGWKCLGFHKCLKFGTPGTICTLPVFILSIYWSSCTMPCFTDQSTLSTHDKKIFIYDLGQFFCLAFAHHFQH